MLLLVLLSVDELQVALNLFLIKLQLIHHPLSYTNTIKQLSPIDRLALTLDSHLLLRCQSVSEQLVVVLNLLLHTDHSYFLLFKLLLTA